jgi:methylmalonyl-CoA epimerase
MIRKIDHISIAVKNTDEFVSQCAKAFGFEVEETMLVPEQGFRTTMIKKEDIRIEVLEPIGEGPIAKFVDKRGNSLHHVSFRVDDIRKDAETLKGEGIRLVSNEPLQATETAQTNFVHPGSLGGIMIELIERG